MKNYAIAATVLIPILLWSAALGLSVYGFGKHFNVRTPVTDAWDWVWSWRYELQINIGFGLHGPLPIIFFPGPNYLIFYREAEDGTRIEPKRSIFHD